MNVNDLDIRFENDAFEFRWFDKNGYFGTIIYYKDRNYNDCISTETLGKEFVKQCLNKLIDNAKLID